MKLKILILLLLTLISISCVNNIQQEKLIKMKKTNLDAYDTAYKSCILEFTYDECEYIYVKSGYGGGLTHKGNCKNCSQKNKQ